MNLKSKIAELKKDLAEISNRFSAQEAILVQQGALIKRQAALITSQTKEIEELTRLLSERAVRTTSKNSHLPPSLDLTRSSNKSVNRNQSLREKSDKPVGGQKGHKGHNLKMIARPDVVKDLTPNYCNACGASLEGEAVFVGRRQVIDIPPIVPITTEYRQYSKVCSCGHCQHSSYPQAVQHPIQYGPNIQGYVIYQNVYQYMPFQRLQDFFKKT